MKRSLIAMLVLLLTMVPVALAEDQDKGSSLSTAGPFTKRAPGQLTTLFAANNGYAGNMLDIEPLSTINEITALDINWTMAGEVVQVEIYYKMGTCVGYGTDPSAWTLLSTGTGTAVGADLPTFIDLLGNGVAFDAGELYGLYVHVENFSSLSGNLGYTNASNPKTYANTELSATCYYGTAHPAFSGIFTYRIWNGTIYYEAGPPLPLTVHPDEVSAWFGGTATFKLNGGPDLAQREYGIFGTVSGTLPGTPLPGGLVLPLNWDWFTETVLVLSLIGNPMTTGFIGTLDGDGFAKADLWFPGHCQLFDELYSNFSWCTALPFDFVSNPVELTILPGMG